MLDVVENLLRNKWILDINVEKMAKMSIGEQQQNLILEDTNIHDKVIRERNMLGRRK